jgi:hypothetical protein
MNTKNTQKTQDANYSIFLKNTKTESGIECMSNALATGTLVEPDVIFTKMDATSDTLEALAMLLDTDGKRPGIEPHRIASILYECAGSNRLSAAMLRAREFATN